MPPEVRWRIDDGEEARLTPEGPTAASLASRGPFPFLRVRVPGQSPLRPAFPGSCVALDERDFEVVEAREQDGGALYLLEPWPPEHVRRDRFAYGADLVRRSVATPKVLIDFHPGRSGDGMCLDSRGSLYVAAGLHQRRGTSETLDTKPGIHVISPQGKLLAYVETPEDTITNCAFGGRDLRTLYITAGAQLLSIRTKTPGRAAVSW